MNVVGVKGKTAVVTGAAGGLGTACALKLAEAGANVVAADINYEAAQRIAAQVQELGVKGKAVKFDATSEDEAFSLVNSTVKEFGQLDIMVNCAGLGLIKPLPDFTYEEICKLVDVNLKGVIFCCKAAVIHMIPRKEGKIVNFSSSGAKVGLPGCAVYAATKAGVIALTHTLAREVAEHNINVNAVSPGMIRTPMWEGQLNFMTGNGPESAKAEIFNGMISGLIPLKRPQEPDDIANMVLYLSSDLGKNITGQTFNIDGGAVIY